MPIPDAIIVESKDHEPMTAEANNVISIQNDWLAALLACEIPDKKYSDCIACNHPRCAYAWGKHERIEALEKLIKDECCFDCLAAVNRDEIGLHCEGCDVYAVLEVEP